MNGSNRYTKSTIQFDWKDKMVFEWKKKMRKKILNRYLYDYYYYFKLRSSRPITKMRLHNLHCSLSFSGYFSQYTYVYIFATTFNWKQLFVVCWVRFRFDRIRRNVYVDVIFMAAVAYAFPFTGKMSCAT